MRLLLLVLVVEAPKVVSAHPRRGVAGTHRGHFLSTALSTSCESDPSTVERVCPRHSRSTPESLFPQVRWPFPTRVAGVTQPLDLGMSEGDGEPRWART